MEKPSLPTHAPARPWAPLLAWGWTAAILAICWLPARHMPVDESGPRALAIPHLDKAVHFLLFAGFGFLGMRTRSMGGRPWLVALAGAGLAVVSELGQELEVVGRDANLADAMADLGGVVVAVALYRMARRRT